MQLLHGGDLAVAHIMLAADALGGGGMGASNVSVGGGTVSEAWQVVEDGATPVVEQQDAQVATEILVPQRILVVKEAKVANDAKDEG